MAEAFREYYARLYNQTNVSHVEDSHPLQSVIAAYLSESGLPTLPEDDVVAMEHPITLEELDKALNDSPSGKAPGPDGFPVSYYKSYRDILSSKFLKAFNQIADQGNFPDGMLHSHITVIAKEGKDPSVCANYRPIALINTDIKLFSKILANRLLPLLPQVIHFDQAGFVPTREARDNITRVLDLIHQSTLSRAPSLLLSTDAEKAFDRVAWPFILGTLKHLGLGTRMITAMMALYTNPTASVVINGHISEPFQMHNGTRQGCPLSPLVFVLTLEPFLCKIRTSADIGGIRIGQGEHRVAAFADDLIFFLTQPILSIPVLLKELAVYREI